MSLQNRFQEMFYCCQATPVEHEGATYFVTDGTGEGVFAYSEEDFRAGVEAAEGATEEHYSAFCDYTTPETDHELARAIHRELGLSICHGGTCSTVLDFVNVSDELYDTDFEEGGSAYIKNQDLYVRRCEGADERYIGPVSDDILAWTEIQVFFD